MAEPVAARFRPSQDVTRSAPVNTARPRQGGRLNVETQAQSVSRNGCFEFDRILKSGYVEKRTQKTKVRRTLWTAIWQR